VLFANGTVTDLNAPGTGLADASANAINDNGVIVGQGGNDRAGMAARAPTPGWLGHEPVTAAR
jgi:uncharacterized membrane protein